VRPLRPLRPSPLFRNAPNVVYMAGMKFGSTGPGSLSRGAMNSFLSRTRRRSFFAIAESPHFPREMSMASLPSHKPVRRETDSPQSRRRIRYELSRAVRARARATSAARQIAKWSILRLNYATELRYGVLGGTVARRVLLRQTPCPSPWGYLNAIWQAGRILRGSRIPPARVFSSLCVEHRRPRASQAFAVSLKTLRLAFKKRVEFDGVEAPDALLSKRAEVDATFLARRGISYEQMDRLDWPIGLSAAAKTLAKPTHFENRAGRFLSDCGDGPGGIAICGGVFCHQNLLLAAYATRKAYARACRRPTNAQSPAAPRPRPRSLPRASPGSQSESPSR